MLKLIPKKQTGGEIKQFYKEYIKSPNYKKRLVTQGWLQPDLVIKDRLANLSGIKEATAKPGYGNEYILKDNTVYLDKDETKKYKLNPLSLKAHEYSHSVGSIVSKKLDVKSTLQLGGNDINQLESRNKLIKQGPPKDDEAYWLWLHDTRPNEIKADMDGLRFRLKKDGLYDTGTQKFNKELLDKSKVQYKSDPVIQRLIKAYPSKDLIYLMNNIAKVDNDVTDQLSKV